jgi:hypothetical protein
MGDLKQFGAQSTAATIATGTAIPTATYDKLDTFLDNLAAAATTNKSEITKHMKENAKLSEMVSSLMATNNAVMRIETHTK